MATAAQIPQGPPTDVVLGGASNANQQPSVIIPNTGPSAIDKAKTFKESRMNRFSKVVDNVVTGKIDPKQVLTGGGAQQVQVEQMAGAGETIPDRQVITETPEVDAVDQAQDTVGQDNTNQTGEKSRLERVQEARVKAKADASRVRARQAQARDREIAQQRLAQENAQLRQAAQRGQQIEQLFRTDPIAAAKMAGLTPEQMVQRTLQDGSPEGQIEELKRMVLQERSEREKLVEQQRTAKFEAGLRQAEEALWKRSQNVDRYPNIVGVHRDTILALAEKVVQSTRSHYSKTTGVVPPIHDGMILRKLNELLVRGETQDAAGSKATGSAKQGKQAATGSTKAPHPRTLTNSLTNGSFTRPSNWEELPRAERVKLLKEQARSGR